MKKHAAFRMIFAAIVIVLNVASIHAEMRTDNLARVYIYREGRFVGGALEPAVRFDGARLVSISNGSYYGGLFPPGEHTFELYDKKSGARLELEAGKSYYFRIEIVPGVFVGGSRMTVIQPEQGGYEVEKLRHVGEANIANYSIPFVNDPAFSQRKTMELMRKIAARLVERIGRRLPAEADHLGIDAWGTPFKYQRSADGTSYMLISAGSDRKFDETTWATEHTLMNDSADDAVIAGQKAHPVFVRTWRIDG